MMNHTELLLMCDLYGDKAIQELSRSSRRIIKYWKIKGFPKSVIRYIRLAAKWEQIKSEVDPNGNLRSCKHIKEHRSQLEVQKVMRQSEITKMKQKKKELQQQELDERARKINARKVSLDSRPKKNRH